MLHLYTNDVPYMADVAVYECLQRRRREALVLDLPAFVLRFGRRQRFIIEVRIIRALGQRSTP